MQRFKAHHAAALLIVLALIGAACGGGSGGGATTSAPGTTSPPASSTSTAAPTTTTMPSVTTTTAGPTTTEVPVEPSQSAEAAARDGVIAEVASLPFDVRVEVIEAVPATEGVWVISHLTELANPSGDGCRLGPEDGEYPTDFICTFEYGELLLLDETQSSIVRAYPFAGVPPEMIEVTPDAVYCGRHGALPLPDSMVCRIDRSTFAATVRVFPPGVDSAVVQPCFYPPASWSFDDEPLDVLAIEAAVNSLAVQGSDGSSTLLDPASLEVIERGVTR